MLNPNQYDVGPKLKVAALRVGDKVWHDRRPDVVTKVCQHADNWYVLSFASGDSLGMGGNHTLERAELRMVPDDKARTVNVVELAKENEAQRNLIVDLRVEAQVFEAQAINLQRDVDALEKELRWRDARIQELDRSLEGYRKGAMKNATSLVTTETKVRELQKILEMADRAKKELERQVRHGDKRIRCQQDEIEELEENLRVVQDQLTDAHTTNESIYAQLEAIISGT